MRWPCGKKGAHPPRQQLHKAQRLLHGAAPRCRPQELVVHKPAVSKHTLASRSLLDDEGDIYTSSRREGGGGVEGEAGGAAAT